MTLYLLPNLNAPTDEFDRYLPGGIRDILATVDGVYAETAKVIRPLLKHYLGEAFRDLPVIELNEHTKKPAALLKKGERWALFSDSGNPCLADPGSRLVAAARTAGIDIVALLGPSAIIEALMLSGFPAQSFTFHGYPPKKPDERETAFQRLKKGTHLFIEAPYRAKWTLQTLLQSLPKTASLCVAADLSLPTQNVQVGPPASFKGFTLEKQPAVFVIHIV